MTDDSKVCAFCGGPDDAPEHSTGVIVDGDWYCQPLCAEEKA